MNWFPTLRIRYGLRRILVCSGCALVAMAGTATAQPSRADLEQQLLQGLANGTDVVHLRNALADLGESREVSLRQMGETDHVGRLLDAATRDLHKGHGPDHLLAADLLVREHFQIVRSKLEAIEVSAEIMARLDAAQASYDEVSAEVLSAAERHRAGTATEDDLKLLSPPVDTTRPVLRASNLPYRRPALAPRPLVAEPAIVPAYLDISAAPPTADDLQPTLDAPFAAAVLAKAEELEHDYVSIYEFVHSEIRTEWYAGSMKGAEQTLLQGAGNDVDQANLLIALLRASGAGARYVHGVVEVPVERLMDDFGLTEGLAVADALRRAGIPYESVVQGGRVAALRYESTWVTAYLPFANYRGSAVELEGSSWVPLAPAFTRWETEPATGVLQTMERDLEAFVEEQLSTLQDELPLDRLRNEIIDFLAQNAPGEAYEDQLAVRQQVVSQLGYAPDTLPFSVVAVTREVAEVPENERHTVRFVLRRGSSASDEPILEHEVPVSEAAGRRVTVSYLPATVDDHRVTQAYGGLSRVPLYLIKVRAQLKIDGRQVAVSEATLEPAGLQRLDLRLTGPSSQVTVDRLLTVGSYAAIGVEAQQQLWSAVAEDDPRDTEFLAARLLAGVARTYGSRWWQAEEELARLLDIVVVRPLPAVTFAASEVTVESINDLPYRLIFDGVSLDAPLRGAEPVSAMADPDSARHFQRLAGLQGSALEHRVFEDDFGIASVSADKGLAVAASANVQVLDLVDSADPSIDTLAHPPYVVEAVRESLQSGYSVRIPQAPVTYLDWVGSAWRAEQSATGEAGYFLSGELAGGTTALDPASWPDQFLPAALASPYSGPPNDDPLSAALITKVLSTDQQFGRVGRYVGAPFAVIVRDIIGRPVVGAEVTFTVLQGDGNLFAPLADGPTVVAKTDQFGVAEADYQFGQITENAPIYEIESNSDPYPMRLLHSKVDVTVRGRSRQIPTESPFEAYAYPGEPDRLVRQGREGQTTFPDGDPSTPERVPLGGLWSDTLVIQAQDEYGNSVSKVPVSFRSGSVTSDCEELDDTKPTLFFDARLDRGPKLRSRIELGDSGDVPGTVSYRISNENDFADPEAGRIDGLSAVLTLQREAGGVVASEARSVGSLVQGAEFAGSFQVPPDLEPGAYILRLEAENGIYRQQTRAIEMFVQERSDLDLAADLLTTYDLVDVGQDLTLIYELRNPTPEERAGIVKTVVQDASLGEIVVFQRDIVLAPDEVLQIEGGLSTTMLLGDSSYIARVVWQGSDGDGGEEPRTLAGDGFATGPSRHECEENPYLIADCGLPSMIRLTGPSGVAAGLILGTRMRADTEIVVESPPRAPLTYHYLESGGLQDPSDDCFRGAAVYMSRGFYSYKGKNVSATKVSEWYAPDIGVRYFTRPVLLDQLVEFDPTWVVGDVQDFVDNADSPAQNWPYVMLPWDLEVYDSQSEPVAGASEPWSVNHEGYFATSGDCPVPGEYVSSGRVGDEVGKYYFGSLPWTLSLTYPIDPDPDECDWRERVNFGDVGPPGDFEILLDQQVFGSAWGLDPKIVDTEPVEFTVARDGSLAEHLRVRVDAYPEGYEAASLDVEILSDGQPVASESVATALGQAEALFPRGTLVGKTNLEARVVLNRGTEIEVVGDPMPLQPLGTLILDYADDFLITQEADVAANYLCEFGTKFWFVLAREAYVTLQLLRIQGIDQNGDPLLSGDVLELISDEKLSGGRHERIYTMFDVPAGEYVLVLEARSSEEGSNVAQTERGRASSRFTVRDSLPLGHTLIHGVDVWDGALTIQRTDFDVPAREIPLRFTRTYSGNRVDPGPLGVGWGHNWESKIFKTPCNEWVIQGGEGSGARFLPLPGGEFKAVRGLHGSLVSDFNTGNLIYYTISGLKYTYTQLLGDFVWVLESIEDPHGNKTVLRNEGNAFDHRLMSVRSSSGEAISFDWIYKETPLWDGWVVEKVKGPGGQTVDFEYDHWGNLTKSVRNEFETEDFEYPEDGNLAARHRLLKAKNELTGAEDTYSYLEIGIVVEDTTTVPLDAVLSVQQSDGGTTTFIYDEAALSDRGAAIVQTKVEDARENTWIYDLNQYGAVERVQDPLGNESFTEWDLEHVKVKSRTDANGVVSSYVYDDYGNVRSESIGGITRSYEYFPPEAFAPPYIKNRVKKLINRNGVVTNFKYDGKGRLTDEETIVYNVDDLREAIRTEYAYYPNGDLRTVTEPELNITTFQYNARGQRTKITDAKGFTTSTDFDGRGRKKSMTDAEGRKTSFTYDEINRPKTRTFVALSATWLTTYIDELRRRDETDPEGNFTQTWFDTRGRITRIKNAEAADKYFEYDEEGNKDLESNWFGEYTVRADTMFEYDTANRLERRTEPWGRSTSHPMPTDYCAEIVEPDIPFRITEYEHDPVGNLESETIKAPRMSPKTFKYGYDVLNRRTSEKRHDDQGAEVGSSWEFDGQGNKILETDALGRERSFVYDELDRLESEAGPEGTGREMVYDKNGNLEEERTFNFVEEDSPSLSEPERLPYKQIRTFTYDKLNRVETQTDAEGYTTTFVYDKVGNVTRHIDARGNSVETTYTAHNLPELIEYFGTVRGTRTKLRRVRTYDNLGNLETDLEPNGRLVTHEYDGMNRRTRSYDAIGTFSETTYTDSGKVRTQTDANGNVASNHYDLLDRLDLQDLPEDRMLCWAYDGMGNAVEQYDARGVKTDFAYDQLDRLKSTTDADGFVESYTWDKVGNQLSVTNRRGNTTDYGYDDLNRQTLVEDPPLAADAEGLPPGQDPPRQKVERRFDALGNLLRETDRRGIVSIFEYDHESRLVQSERAGLVIETMQYDGNDNRIASTDANGNLTTFEFDERNLLTRVNAPLLAISRFELDESGDRVKETDPENKVIEREYDDRRRLEAEIVAGDRTEFGYDGNGNLTSIDRPETPAWLRTYDGADRLKTVEDPNGGVTEYFYDGNGNLTSQVDAELKETLFEYNDLNRLTLKTLADGAVATYDAYDENGNLTQRTDPNGTVFALSYDELDRLVTLDLPNELDIGAMRKRQFTYDRNNNLRGVTESRIGADATTLVPVTASRTYDDFDRLSTVTDRWGTTVLYGYDDNGNRTSVTGDGLSAIYRYDALNRMETVTSGLGVTEYEYYKNSRLKSVNYPNGAVAEYTWDLSNRLDTIDNRVNLALVSRFDYAYDGNGNRILQLEERTGDPEETTTYSYDLLDRLEVVVYPDQETTYTYDGVGNRRTEQSVLTGDSGDPPAGFLVDRIYSYNDRHQVEQVENLATDGATVTYGYDPNGNQISRASTTDGVTSFTFDVFNRMTEVERAGRGPGHPTSTTSATCASRRRIPKARRATSTTTSRC